MDEYFEVWFIYSRRLCAYSNVDWFYSLKWLRVSVFDDKVQFCDELDVLSRSEVICLDRNLSVLKFYSGR